ncbi:MAG: ATP-binding protein [Alphaproteobacteria bacterium]|nr:ATP-binding protein [Alphaproteobacteria bacterium]MCB9699165.1 ATP-binding protein [Alphaproteobacteria bacterium]
MSTSLFSDLARRLRRTDLLLLRAVRRQRARPAMRAKGQFWGSVITDDEVDALLRAHGEIDYPAGADGLDDAIAASTAYRDAEGGRLARLQQSFTLDGDDMDLVLLALAPEISAGYGKIFAYLNDNLNQAYLTVDLATRILRQERRQRLSLQSRLLPGAPLIRNRLLLLNPPDGMDTHTSRRVHPAPRLLQWMLRDAAVSMSEGATQMDTTRIPFVPVMTRDRLEQLKSSLQTPITVAIVGGTTGMREGVAMAVARAAERPLVRVDIDRCKAYLQQPNDLVRDLMLDGAVPYLVNVPDTSEEPALRMQMMNLGTALSELPYTVTVGGNDRRAVQAMLGSDRPNVTVPVGRSTNAERIGAWAEAIERRGWDPGKAPELAERFYSIGGTTIERVLERAQAEAGNSEPDNETLWGAAREAARPEFSGLAQRVVPRYTWGDLILPDKIIGQLKHLEQYLAQQEKVMQNWGGQKIRPRGYGIKALFSGAPGTGKTMCAEVIAGGLGLDLFKVDLSSVISRWVGETEKNLKEIFDAAEGGSSVILFDEADSLFGSRGDVKQAQDRFANQEVSFLLQRLEVFEGCAVLTTNLQENIDEAFLRRFGAVIEFPMPSPSERRRLWERAIPDGAPRQPSLDLDYIANQFVLAGGSIINASINACVVAAAEGQDVGMRHCINAIARELYKMGKQINRVHFGEYYDEVKDLF